MLKISKGKKAAPVMAAIYGVEGVGKTTLAAALPGALIIDVEEGAVHYDIARIDAAEVDTWEKMIDMIGYIYSSPDDLHKQGYHTIVFDSVDAIESLLLIPFTLKVNGKPGGSLADFDWGRGYDREANDFKRFLSGCSALMQKGFNIVFIVHSQQKEINPPDNPPYSHYELKLNKKLCALLKEKVDMLLFATYETYTIKEGNANKAKSTKRVLVCQHTAYADAKNRFGFPSKIDMNPDILKPYFPVPDITPKTAK